MPSLSDADVVTIGARRSKENDAIVDNAAVDGGGGASITAIDIDVALRRSTGLTNPDTIAANERRDTINTKDRVMLVMAGEGIDVRA